MQRLDDQARELVRAALALPPAARAGFLRDRSGGPDADPARINALLAAVAAQEVRTLAGETHGHAATSPPQSPPADADSPVRPGLPARLGGYRILDLLGEGGMGVVYLAEQDRPRRTVALKVIRAGLLTPRLLRRFELETQTLARLQHPGIAQVFEAGTLDGGGAGQPYFAMEYIRGQPLNDFAESRALDVPARLSLFGRVCDAVQHAHQRGVIHRDLKSSNILITADGQVKVLDFGVAKLADAGDAGNTPQTDAGQIVGTVPYMSPEQIAGRPEDVDTRSDVYTLGVVLFELLTGRLPHRVSGKTIVEASRIIAAESAPRLGSLSGEFKGDLETIVAKAIDKDRQRRYQSPAELAADLERYLRDEPILARPPSTAYHLRKFARRNRPVVLACAAAAGVLVLGVVGIAWQAVEATRGRDLAQRLRVAADEAKAAAVKEAEVAREINGLLTDMLQSADPDVSLGREVTVAEVLDRTAANLESAVHEPRVLASVRSTLAATYQNLNRLAQAETQARAALAVLESSDGPEAVETLDARQNLVNILCDAGRFAEAEPIARAVLEASMRRFGDGSAETVAPLTTLSRVLHESGKVADAEAVLDRALEIASARLGERHPQTLFAMHNKASALKDAGRFDEAIAMLRRVIDLRRQALGPRHSQTLSSMNNLAAALQKAGRNQEALAILTEIYDLRREMYGEEHAAALATLTNIAVCRIAMKQPEVAEPLLRRAVDGFVRTLGQEHNKTLVAMANLGFLEEDLGHLNEAERLYRRVIDIRTHGENPNVPELLAVMNNLAMLLASHGRSAEAAPVFADLVSRAEAALPAGHYLIAIFRNNAGDCLRELGRVDEARPLLESSLRDLEASLGAEHPRTVKARERLAKLPAPSGAGR